MTNDYGNLELHKILLSAMKDIDKICRENHLRYYLHAGTLLGAINHKGFIPWDDDVDISMTRDDYEKFVQILKTSGLNVQTGVFAAHMDVELVNNGPVTIIL